jgi:hypothetical protein
MAGRTREKSRQNKKRNHKRRAQTKKNQKPTPTPTPTPIIESHRFMSSMTFDGNTLTTQTQKDDEPVIRRRYTKEQLEREIPIGKEMVDMYLDGKMPKELQSHHHRRPVFRNVLISPADLGLLPPRELERPIAKMSRRRRQRRHHRLDNDDNDDNDNDDNDDELEMVVNEHGKKKHIFDLP